MIERLRRGAQSGLSYILIGVLIVFFAVFFGVPADGCMAGDGQRALMASVDGEDIHTEEVNIIQNRYFSDDRSGTRTQDEDYFRNQAEALRIVITTYLLGQRAEEAGLRVSDEEFADFITDPARNVEFLHGYGSGGQFDGPFYERYVQQALRVPVPSYEDFKRQELLARKYLTMLDMQVHPTSSEVDELHRQRNTRVDLEYVDFNEDDLVELVGVDDDDIDEFIDSDDGQQRIEEYFEEHRDDYTDPAEVRLRTIQIFKPSGEDPPESEVQEAQERFDEARQRVLEEGEPIGAVAPELSDDEYRDYEGLWDWQTLDAIPTELRDATEDADIGDINEYEADYAYGLVEVDDRREEVVESLEDVQREIAETLLRRDIVDTTGGQLAETLYERVADGVDLVQALEDLEQEARDDERDDDADLWANLNVETTGLFALEDEQMPDMGGAQADMFGAGGSPWYDIPGLGEDRDLAVAAFDLTEDNPLMDGVVELDDARAVVRLNEREEPGELSDSERAELETEAQREKSRELLGDWRLFFLMPTEEMGHYIEEIFNEAMADGSIRLFERNSRAASLLRAMSEQGDDIVVEDHVDMPERQQPAGIDDFEGDDEPDEPGEEPLP